MCAALYMFDEINLCYFVTSGTLATKLKLTLANACCSVQESGVIKSVRTLEPFSQMKSFKKIWESTSFKTCE